MGSKSVSQSCFTAIGDTHVMKGDCHRPVSLVLADNYLLVHPAAGALSLLRPSAVTCVSEACAWVFTCFIIFQFFPFLFGQYCFYFSSLRKFRLIILASLCRYLSLCVRECCVHLTLMNVRVCCVHLTLMNVRVQIEKFSPDE